MTSENNLYGVLVQILKYQVLTEAIVRSKGAPYYVNTCIFVMFSLPFSSQAIVSRADYSGAPTKFRRKRIYPNMVTLTSQWQPRFSMGGICLFLTISQETFSSTTFCNLLCVVYMSLVTVGEALPKCYVPFFSAISAIIFKGRQVMTLLLISPIS